MQRTVTTPAVLSGEALEDLKSWLGISRPSEDALLTDLLGASLSLCEAFTGQAPIEQTVEEKVPAYAGQYALRSRPVRALLSVELISDDGTRSALADSDYDFRIDDADVACLGVGQTLEGRGVAISTRVGIAADWANLPHALKQGAIRLSAFQYRDRDSLRTLPPPASVTALWRPWRSIRIV